MIVSVLNTKGGVGKTTLAVNFAIARAMIGRSVWLVDGDRQATAQQAIAQRVEAGRLPSLAVSHYADGPMLRAQVLQQRGHFDDVVIDAGGRDSTALRAALMLSDVVVVPFQPRSFDVWGVGDMAEIAAEAVSMRDGLKIFAVLNGADPGGKDNAEAAAAVAEFTPIVYLNTPIGRRKGIAEAAGGGLSVLEVSGNQKSKIEMSALISAVFSNQNDS
jgi:chromosome partitioning protein